MPTHTSARYRLTAMPSARMGVEEMPGDDGGRFVIHHGRDREIADILRRAETQLYTPNGLYVLRRSLAQQAA